MPDVPPVPSVSRPPRRWWTRIRLSLRTMMILILMLGGGLGWLVHRAHVQRDAVHTIREAGGKVVYDWGWGDGYPNTTGSGSRWPTWLVDALGPDFFDTVKAVYLGGDPDRSTASDALMESVGRLGRLEFLDLSWSKSVTDEGIAHLRGLTSLKHLDLTYVPATGASLRHLAGMTRLKKLELPSGRIVDADLAHLKGLTDLEWFQAAAKLPEVTDAGLAHLSGLVKLKVFSIHSPGVTSSGLKYLEDMERLENLNLHGASVIDIAPIGHLPNLTSLALTENPVTDAGLADLKRLTKLTHLFLDRTKITDAGLPEISRLTELQNLYLNDTAIGDAGLVHLSGLNKITLLFLEGTRVTDAGIANLAGLAACNQVAIGGTAVTDAGIKAAQANRPTTRFVRMRQSSPPGAAPSR